MKFLKGFPWEVITIFLIGCLFLIISGVNPYTQSPFHNTSSSIGIIMVIFSIFFYPLVWIYNSFKNGKK